jgi:hypothetical protein
MGHASNLGVFTFPENSITLSSTSIHGHALEIPILAKGYLRAERSTFRPFVTGGLAIHRTSLESRNGASILGGTNLLPLPSEPVFQTESVLWKPDPSAGAGVDFKAGRFHLEPQVRYSYWAAGKNSDIRKNQVHFLLGFRF